jgi:triphosphatase
MPSSRDVELRLELPARSLTHVTRGLVGPASRTGAKTPAKVVSVYFDTKKLKLRKKGLSLRVRRIGQRHVQTIRRDGVEDTGFAIPHEWERDIDDAKPDLEAARETALEPLLGKKLRRGLKPVFATRVERRVHPIRSNNAEIDLVVDKGKIEAGRRSSPLCEVELELRRGDEAELFKLARRLAEEVPIQLAVESKAERGYRLAAGDKFQAVKNAPVGLTPELDVHRAFQAIAGACLRQLAANVPTIRREDPEALHQGRVALRRLRTAVSLFSPMLADAQTAALKRELKWITGEFGPARELEVFLTHVVKPLADGKGRGPGLAVLTKDLRQKRKDAFQQALVAVDSARFRRLVVDTLAWIETGDWRHNGQDAARSLREQTIADAGGNELKRRWKKVLKNGKHVAKLDPERRHRLRIQAKKLRYAAEFMAAAFPGKKSTRLRKRFLSRLKELQDALGELNDIVVHEELVEGLAQTEGRHKRGQASTRKAFAAGQLSGREESRMASVMKEAQRAYAGFAKVKPFWT